MRAHVFADEAGNFDFSRTPGASKYFILCTATVADCSVGDRLLQLRRELACTGFETDRPFHCTEDAQSVRDKVFEMIAATPGIRVDATILEKSKAQPQVRASHASFYKYAWFYHFKHIAPLIAEGKQEILIAAASVGTGRKKTAFKLALESVATQVTPLRKRSSVAFWPAHSEPCLQIADYCTWAIQRKWERGDARAYDLIEKMVESEYDLWSRGGKHYY